MTVFIIQKAMNFCYKQIAQIAFCFIRIHTFRLLRDTVVKPYPKTKLFF